MARANLNSWSSTTTLIRQTKKLSTVSVCESDILICYLDLDPMMPSNQSRQKS